MIIMDPSFSVWLCGVLRGKEDNCLTRLNQSELFEPQVLGLIREFASPWHWKETRRMDFSSEYDWDPMIIHGIIYVGFAFVDGARMLCIDPKDGRQWTMTFDMTRRGKFQRPSGVCGYTFHPQHQQFVLCTSRPNRCYLEIFDREGQFVRVLAPINLDPLPTLYVHPVLDWVLIREHTHIYWVDWSTGTRLAEWRQESFEISWFHPHPLLPAIWVVHYHDDGRVLSLWNRDGHTLFQTPVDEDQEFAWIPMLNSVLGWEPYVTQYRLWDVDGKMTEDSERHWPCLHFRYQPVFHHTRCYAGQDHERTDDDQWIVEYQLTYQPLGRHNPAFRRRSFLHCNCLLWIMATIRKHLEDQEFILSVNSEEQEAHEEIEYEHAWDLNGRVPQFPRVTHSQKMYCVWAILCAIQASLNSTALEDDILFRFFMFKAISSTCAERLI